MSVPSLNRAVFWSEDLPGKPQPKPTNKYIRNTTTTPNNAINFTFFHHILLFSPRLLTLKSCAPTPNLSVLSTSRSILSPLSSTRSIFSVMIPFTLSISCCTFVIASCFPPSVVPYPTISFFSCTLKSAVPYGGIAAKSVLSGSYRERNCFLISTR